MFKFKKVYNVVLKSSSSFKIFLNREVQNVLYKSVYEFIVYVVYLYKVQRSDHSKIFSLRAQLLWRNNGTWNKITVNYSYM